MRGMRVGSADVSEIDALAGSWFDGWRDAHAGLVPDDLARLRTLQSFQERLAASLGQVRAAGPITAPVGFCMTRGAELYQLYVSRDARGSDLATMLLADAEARLAQLGVSASWLACAIGNERAARGRRRAGELDRTRRHPDFRVRS